MAEIIETAAKAGNFNTLIKAIETLQIADTFKSPGIFTLFAPNDEAFEKLPKETLEALLQDILKLKRIVTYHFSFGDVRSDDLAQISEAETVEGSILAIESTNGIIKVNDANVLKTDILADNGVIHVIDTVLMPAILASK